MKGIQKTVFTLILFIIGITSIFTQASLDSLSRLDYAQSLNDIWGYTDNSGNEYALVGTTTGVSIVDVTNPTNPVEKIFIPGANSTWRDLKAWNDYAYVTNETGDGLMIIDLSDIQNGNAPFINSDCGVFFSAAHNIYIDEFGVAYLFGSRNTSNTALGTVMLDVATDPMVPTVLGYYTTNYVHDGMVRNNIMYTSEINAGQLAIVDVNNKAAPVVLGSHPTLFTTTHAVWISDDANYLFSMDEINGSFVESFDISNPANIQRLDIVQSNPGSGTLPHNLFYYNGFLVTSYYRDGVVIFDASRPHNLIEVASYDTYPEGSGAGSPGCWGVYPYFASENIIASDIGNGLFVLGPTYAKACYLEGTITESATGDPISNAIIQIVELPGIENSGAAGNYATGTPISGTYTVFVGKQGFLSKEFTGVVLNNGIVTTLDVTLEVAPIVSVSGVVKDDQGNTIANALVNFSNPILGLSYDAQTDGSGNFTIPSMYEGNYEASFGKWGYRTDCEPISVSGNTAVEFTVTKGYFDDFSLDLGWSVTGNATTGIWERGEPIGTTFDHDQSNPDFDVNGDCIDQCYVTGNGGGFGGTDDVDGGNTVLSSPDFDLSEYCNPYISFYTWFFNGGGNGAPLDDKLIISITNGSQTEELVRYDASFHDHSSWVFNEFKISDFITTTMTMSLIVETYDLGVGHIVEGGLDVFNVYDADLTWYADLDDDGYSDGTTVMSACQPTGYKALSALSGNGSDDCNDDPNDGGGSINPDATEICDGLDNDCDALVDDNDPSITGQMNPYYPDTDGDGYGAGSPIMLCALIPPSGYSANNEDCNPDDGNLTIPGNPCDDGESNTGGDFVNENCECIGGFIVPTLTQWGITILLLIMLIIGLVVVRQQRFLTT